MLVFCSYFSKANDGVGIIDLLRFTPETLSHEITQTKKPWDLEYLSRVNLYRYV